MKNKAAALAQIKQKTARYAEITLPCSLFGAPAGTRIPDTLIKSQVLYQLSYGHIYAF